MPYRHRTLTAWLGLLAIWLTVVGPLVSQWRAEPNAALNGALSRALNQALNRASSAAPDAIVCSAEHGAHTSSKAGAAPHTLHLDACGYCGFFAHCPAVGTAAHARITPAVRGEQRSAASFENVAAVKAYPCAHARAPPPETA